MHKFYSPTSPTFVPEMLKPRGQNFGLGLGLVTSGLGLGTLWPRPQAFGLGLEL